MKIGKMYSFGRIVLTRQSVVEEGREVQAGFIPRYCEIARGKIKAYSTTASGVHLDDGRTITWTAFDMALEVEEEKTKHG